MNPVVKRVVLRNGIIASLVLVLFVVFSYLFNKDLLINKWLSLGLLVFGFVIATVSVVQVKLKSSGYITFKDSFSSFIITFIFSWSIFTLTNIVLYNVVDEDLGHRFNDELVAMIKQDLEGRKVYTEEQKANHIELLSSTYMYSPKSLFQGLLKTILIASVIGLLLAAVTKKKPITSNTLDDV